jgi:hypothetical protein
MTKASHPLKGINCDIHGNPIMFTTDHGPQKRPASVRQIEAQQRFLANEQLDCSSNASLCSGAARKAPANDPDVQGTGLPGFSQHRARASIVRDDADLMASFALHAADYELHDAWDDVLAASRRLIELLDDRSNAKGETR